MPKQNESDDDVLWIALENWLNIEMVLLDLMGAIAKKDVDGTAKALRAAKEVLKSSDNGKHNALGYAYFTRMEENRAKTIKEVLYVE